jgi:HNH endonuclease
MKQLFLSQGQVALVDDEDHERFKVFRWFYRPERRGAQGYAVRNSTTDGRRRQEYLHRAIMRPEPGYEVIFLDGNRLNCQRSNLRVGTGTDARRHHRRRRDCSAPYKGVSWCAEVSRWKAGIRVDGKLIHLGLHETAEGAARAYDRAAKHFHGEFAVLNFNEERSNPPTPEPFEGLG